MKLVINWVFIIVLLVNVLVNEVMVLVVKYILLLLIYYINSKMWIVDELKEMLGYLNEKFGVVCKINKEI